MSKQLLLLFALCMLGFLSHSCGLWQNSQTDTINNNRLYAQNRVLLRCGTVAWSGLILHARSQQRPDDKQASRLCKTRQHSDCHDAVMYRNECSPVCSAMLLSNITMQMQCRDSSKCCHTWWNLCYYSTTLGPTRPKTLMPIPTAPKQGTPCTPSGAVSIGRSLGTATCTHCIT